MDEMRENQKDQHNNHRMGEQMVQEKNIYQGQSVGWRKGRVRGLN
jgi:hypothetical protein